MRTAAFFAFALIGCGRCGGGSDLIRTEPNVADAAIVDAKAEADAIEAPDVCRTDTADVTDRLRGPEGPMYVDGDPGVGRGTAPDLNGDGIPEIVWAFGMPVIEKMELYQGGTTCAVHLLELHEGGEFTVEPTKHDGWSDFSTKDYGDACEGARCGCTPGTRYYSHLNGRYEEVRSKRVGGTTTPCPDDAQ